jgi:hypothetical protein
MHWRAGLRLFHDAFGLQRLGRARGGAKGDASPLYLLAYYIGSSALVLEQAGWNGVAGYALTGLSSGWQSRFIQAG